MEGGYRNLIPSGQTDRQAAIEFLSSYLPRFRRVVWFDDSDSSGILRSYVMPLVDMYAKSQLMKNKEYYNEPHVIGALHRDYVNERYAFEETRSYYKGAVGREGIEKLRIGWNLALIDWHFRTRNRLLKRFGLFFPSKTNVVRPVAPRLHNRPVHISYRVNLWEATPTVYWWRKQTFDHIEALAERHPEFDIRWQGRLSQADYLREMENAVVVPSPFGVGEICYRDFETFLAGALLFKPNMDHLETWPDLFERDVTYVAHAWDFSDFEEKLEHIISCPRQYEEIAQEGQRRMLAALTDGPAFAEHFRRMLAPA